jgi:hypothetical protein
MIDHRVRRLPHAQQAHLGEVVEAVLVDDGDAGADPVEGCSPFVLAGRQHRIEQRDRMPRRAQMRRRVERAQRRVRLLRLP